MFALDNHIIQWTELTIARLFLGGAPVLSTFYMIMSIKAARQHDILAHTEYAMRCFLYSIEGGGTIRQGWKLTPLNFTRGVNFQKILQCRNDRDPIKGL